MNKKGYTLIEIVVVIAIVAAVGTFGAIGLSKVISNSKEQRYDEMITDIKAAANTYFTIYSEKEEYAYLKNDLYTNGSVTIPISELQDSLLVDQKLKNPKDNESVNGCVVITYDNIELNYKVCPYEVGCGTNSCNN